MKYQYEKSVVPGATGIAKGEYKNTLANDLWQLDATVYIYICRISDG